MKDILTKKERAELALIKPIDLKLLGDKILLDMHNSDDNGDGEVWKVLCPFTGEITYLRKTGAAVSRAKVVRYTPGPLPSKAELKEEARKALMDPT